MLYSPGKLSLGQTRKHDTKREVPRVRTRSDKVQETPVKQTGSQASESTPGGEDNLAFVEDPIQPEPSVAQGVVNKYMCTDLGGGKLFS